MIAAKQMRARGARIAVAALQPVVAEIFAISRFDSVLEVFPDGARARSQRFPPQRSRCAPATDDHEAHSLLGHARVACRSR